MSGPNMKMKMWLPWSELNNTPRATLSELQTLLLKYPRESVLIACARLSIAFNYGPEAEIAANREKTLQWVNFLFQPELIFKLRSFAADGRTIFLQGQLRLIASEVTRLVPDHTSELQTLENHALGELLLRASELLYKPHESVEGNLEALANLIATFLPIYELSSPTDPIMQFLRFYIFLALIIPQLPFQLRAFDVEALFEAEFGFPLKLYCHFIFIFISHAILERDKTPEQWPIDGAIRMSYFKNTTLNRESIRKMFDSVCFSLKDIPNLGQPCGYADFEFIRDHPYFEHEEELYCLDYEYAVSKLESGVLWRLLKNFDSDKERLDYLSFWGNIFEAYIVWLLESYADSKLNSLCPSSDPNIKQGNPLCDIIVKCGTTLVLIEAKMATCSAKVRYSGDWRKMKKYLDDRLVVGTTRPVGIAQLASAIRNINETDPVLLPEWMRGIKKIIPVIVTKDEIGSSWAVNSYLQAHFASQLGSNDFKTFEVAPAVSLSVSSFERCLHALKDHGFSEIIEQRVQSDPTLGQPFDAASSFVSRGAARKVFKHIEILSKLSDEAILDFGLNEIG